MRVKSENVAGPDPALVLPQMEIETLYELTKGEAYITTGVGQHQMWAGQWYKYKYPRQFITSAGLGSTIVVTPKRPCYNPGHECYMPGY